jgi:hypothetical protein
MGLLPKYLIRDIIAVRTSRTQHQVQNKVLSPHGDSGEEARRLDLEVSEVLERLTSRFVELGSLSSAPSLSLSGTGRSSIGSYESSLDRDRDRDRDGVDPNKGEALGLVAQSVQSFLRHRQHQVDSSRSGSAGSTGGRPSGGAGIGIGGFLSSSLLNGSASRPTEQREKAFEENDLLSAFEKIESPLQAMKRAGLDLITTGWGRWATLCITAFLLGSVCAV